MCFAAAIRDFASAFQAVQPLAHCFENGQDHRQITARVCHAMHDPRVIVTKRHGPPPPPLLMHFKFDFLLMKTYEL
jgi:hypothetical protein